MKKIALMLSYLIILSLFISNPLKAQTETDNVKTEIIRALNLWNTAAKNSDIEQFMSLFDDSGNILLVGSDSGEVFKGKDEIKGWLSTLFDFAGFSWEMDRIDIDYNGNTAWVFVDGKMIVTNKTGKTRKPLYRFTGIMVKKNNEWKWRLFNGSNPVTE